MTKQAFTDLLDLASKDSADFAKNYVSDFLPPSFLYNVKLNQSHDDPALKQFDIYPGDHNKIFKLIPSSKVVELLLRKEKVPVWIDISVESTHKNFTVLQLLCAGRFSAEENEFYYIKNGTGPFGIKSPTFPIGFKNDGTKFRLRKKKSLFSRFFKK